MKTSKFWVWANNARDSTTTDAVNSYGEQEERTLFLDGTIAEDSWFDDDITPAMFKDELFSGSGPVTIWINSPGGDCIAASRIYSMLMDYPGDVTIKIDGIAASAASVIAMAGTSVLMAPTSLMMIHNPATVACGDHAEMEKAIEMLNEVKESIINAYEIKTGLTRAKISHLMDTETWMNAKKAMELGFADGMLEEQSADPPEAEGYLFSGRTAEHTLINKITEKTRREKPPVPEEAKATEPVPLPHGRSVDELMERLSLLKN